MKLKKGSSIFGLRSEILLAFMIANDVYKKFNVECVMTEGSGGTHGKNSLHYVGNAIDLRTRDFKEGEVELMVKVLRDKLNEQYDVVIESDHVHVEFQIEG